MFKKSFIVALFLNEIKASTTADESFTNSLADCQTFAAKFANTCTGGTATSTVAAMASAVQTCAVGTNACTNQAATSSGTCSFNRRLCVSCATVNNVVQIRVQTNGLPNHCFQSPSTTIQEQTYDYTSNWQPSSSSNSVSTVSTQSALNSLICNLAGPSDSNVPSGSSLTNNGGTSYSTAWGVATTGALMFGAVSLNSVDPFFPAVYGSVTNTSSATEMLDYCQAHPQAAGIYHYHSASPCLANATLGLTTGANSGNSTAALVSAWTAVPYRTPIGIAKDGRIIYSPYYSNLKSYSSCQVDVCNGISINGVYSYVTTFFHPYIMGCFGAGSNVTGMYQQCSTNPRTCGVTYTSTSTKEAISSLGKMSAIIAAVSASAIASLY